MNEHTKENEIVRLPLWKNCLEEMRMSGVSYGQTFSAEYFETHLRCSRNDMRFGIAISEIRRELENDGFYLCGRGGNGNQFAILPPANNADQMLHYSRRAADALKRGVILGTNTRLDTLTDSERRRHEGLLERMATKAALLQRSAQIANIIRTKAPALLK